MSVAHVIARDLLVRERLLAAATATGFDAQPQSHLHATAEDPSIVLLDLDAPDALDELRTWRAEHPQIRVIAFVSHVARDRWDIAVALGCEVHPRGATARARGIIATT